MPGYDKIELHEAARFIGTMNYGYAGTRELNEALVSRFLVIDMPPADETTLEHVLRQMFPDIKPEGWSRCAAFSWICRPKQLTMRFPQNRWI